MWKDLLEFTTSEFSPVGETAECIVLQGGGFRGESVDQLPLRDFEIIGCFVPEAGDGGDCPRARESGCEGILIAEIGLNNFSPDGRELERGRFGGIVGYDADLLSVSVMASRTAGCVG
jgi:hypothetical protein